MSEVVDTDHVVDPDARLNALCEGWIAAMARGDETALAAFHEATLGRAWALALRITRRPEAAEEVLMDAYLQVWKNPGAYRRERGSPLAWLLTIARSRALDSLRRADRAESHPAPETLNEAEHVGDNDPMDLLLACEAHGALHDALAQLSPVQRQLVALAFFRGLSHDEIAAHAAMPLGTVKSHLRRALLALREQLGAMP
jgi:RNA polymerase sigma-70 factor (ECF subfamily)